MTQEKNEKIRDIKKEQRNLWKIYIKNRYQSILFISSGLILSIFYIQIIQFAQESARPWVLLFIVIVYSIAAYIWFLEEAFFMDKYFEMEKNYYIWKYIEKDSLKRDKTSYNFQSSLYFFHRTLLSKVIGFKRSNILFRRGIHDFRIAKVKKEIDIYFNLIIDLILKKEFNEKIGVITSTKSTNDFEVFLYNFKNVFIKHPGSLNLVALDNFFIILNTRIKGKYEKPYSEIEKEVSEYYINHEKLIEQRSERYHELVILGLSAIIAIIISIVAFYIIQIFLLQS